MRVNVRFTVVPHVATARAEHTSIFPYAIAHDHTHRFGSLHIGNVPFLL